MNRKRDLDYIYILSKLLQIVVCRSIILTRISIRNLHGITKVIFKIAIGLVFCLLIFFITKVSIKIAIALLSQMIPFFK